MKKKYLFLASFLLYISCATQDKQSINVDFLKFVNRDYVRTTTFKQAINQDADIEFVTPLYEFEISDIEIGDACLYAISKEYPEKWVAEAKRGECAKYERDYSILLCQARELFVKDTLILKNELDIYVFFIKMEDLEEPFKEMVEGGIFENYYPKKDSKVYIYLLNTALNRWELIDEQINVDEDIPRVFGGRYMQEVANKRINDYLKR